MNIKQDPRFEEAAECMLQTWMAQELGEYADEEAERYMKLRDELASEYGRWSTDVAHMVSTRAHLMWMELV